MKKQTNPLMLAYILFLVICVIYEFICKIFKLEFPMWSDIIFGVTIASYFFSFASLAKATIQIHERAIKTCENTNNLLEQFIHNPHNDISTEQRRTVDRCKEIINTNNNTIAKRKKEISEAEKTRFFSTVVGFLVFFCITVLDWNAFGIEESADICSIFAFIVILIIDYVEEYILGNYLIKENELLSQLSMINS